MKSSQAISIPDVCIEPTFWGPSLSSSNSFHSFFWYDQNPSL